ncbi:MAG: hypothetical protein K0S32_1991 [Bacteroidetes bacterium]|jgi:hypothetical protein|nr:hypothetical protein [Bacteroidota bacterium]
MSYIKLVIACLIFALIYSCKKSVLKVDKNYIGTWAEEGKKGSMCGLYVVFQINDVGKGTWQPNSMESECKNEAKTGKVKLKSNQLYIGSFFHVTVTQAPTKIDSVLVQTVNNALPVYVKSKMVIDGRNFYRTSE